MSLTAYKDFKFAVRVTEVVPPIGGGLRFAGELQCLFDRQRKDWVVKDSVSGRIIAEDRQNGNSSVSQVPRCRGAKTVLANGPHST
jgi:hypothetical protein